MYFRRTFRSTPRDLRVSKKLETGSASSSIFYPCLSRSHFDVKYKFLIRRHYVPWALAGMKSKNWRQTEQNEAEWHQRLSECGMNKGSKVRHSQWYHITSLFTAPIDTSFIGGFIRNHRVEFRVQFRVTRISIR